MTRWKNKPLCSNGLAKKTSVGAKDIIGGGDSGGKGAAQIRAQTTHQVFEFQPTK